AIEHANPEAFENERLSHWRRSSDQYLNPERVAALFGSFQGRTLTMQTRRSGLQTDYFMHGDPSRSGDNFAFAVAHREVIDNEPHVIFDELRVWKPKDFPDNNNEIDYRIIKQELAGFIDAYEPTQISFDQFPMDQTIQELRDYVR